MVIIYKDKDGNYLSVQARDTKEFMRRPEVWKALIRYSDGNKDIQKYLPPINNR